MFCLPRWQPPIAVSTGPIPVSVEHCCKRVHSLMSLIPRWRYMTDEAKALTKRTAVSALVVLLVLLVFRALVPWVLVALVAWWIWKAVSK